MGLRYRFSQAAVAKIVDAGRRLGSDSNAAALRELLGLGATLARYTADDGALWFEDPGTNRYDGVPVLGRDWHEALETGARSNRLLTIYCESLLPQIGNAASHLGTRSLESTMQAMTVIGIEASHYMAGRRVCVWNPNTGLNHAVSLPAVLQRQEAHIPSVR